MTLTIDEQRIHRMLILIQLIKDHDGLSPQTLAQQLSIDEEALYDDLKQLSDSGIPVYFSQKGYQINPSGFISPPHLSLQETLLLNFGLNLLEHHGVIDQTKLDEIQSKIIPSHTFSLEQIQDSIQSSSPIKNPIDCDILATLSQMIIAKQRAQIQYRSKNQEEPAWREISPYILIYRKETWYTIGYCHKNSEVRTFKVSRIHDIQESQQDFYEDEDFNVEEYLLYSWNIMHGEPNVVMVRFDHEVGPLILEKEVTHGRVWKEKGFVYLRTVVSGLEEFSWWIMQYGEHAEILYPRELRVVLAKRCAKMAAKYGEPLRNRSERVKPCRNTSL